MPTTSNCDSGFTIIEVLAAVLIMMIGLLGLLQSINVALSHDMRNKLRDEAVILAEEQLNKFRMYSTGLATGTYVGDAARNIKGVDKIFRVTKDWATVSSTDAARKLTVTVNWSYKNVSASHSITSVIRR